MFSLSSYPDHDRNSLDYNDERNSLEEHCKLESDDNSDIHTEKRFYKGERFECGVHLNEQSITLCHERLGLYI